MKKRTSFGAVAGLLCVVMAMALAPARLSAQTIAAEIDQEKAELRQYRLTMPKIRQMAAATLAFAKDVEGDAALQQKLKSDTDPEPRTLVDLVKRIDKEPRLAAAVKTAGLTSREYATVMLCYYPAMMAFSAKKAGAITEIPKDILPDNVALIEANEAELMRLNQELEAHDINK
jgi:hypothetical protein